MPATSQKQQRFMAMVEQYKKGKLKKAGPEIREAARSMSAQDAHDFAATPRKDLPEKAAKQVEVMDRAQELGFLVLDLYRRTGSMEKAAALVETLYGEAMTRLVKEAGDMPVYGTPEGGKAGQMPLQSPYLGNTHAAPVAAKPAVSPFSGVAGAASAAFAPSGKPAFSPFSGVAGAVSASAPHKPIETGGIRDFVGSMFSHATPPGDRQYQKELGAFRPLGEDQNGNKLGFLGGLRDYLGRANQVKMLPSASQVTGAAGHALEAGKSMLGGSSMGMPIPKKSADMQQPPAPGQPQTPGQPGALPPVNRYDIQNLPSYRRMKESLRLASQSKKSQGNKLHQEAASHASVAGMPQVPQVPQVPQAPAGPKMAADGVSSNVSAFQSNGNSFGALPPIKFGPGQTPGPSNWTANESAAYDAQKGRVAAAGAYMAKQQTRPTQPASMPSAAPKPTAPAMPMRDNPNSIVKPDSQPGGINFGRRDTASMPAAAPTPKPTAMPSAPSPAVKSLSAVPGGSKQSSTKSAAVQVAKALIRGMTPHSKWSAEQVFASLASKLPAAGLTQGIPKVQQAPASPQAPAVKPMASQTPTSSGGPSKQTAATVGTASQTSSSEK